MMITSTIPIIPILIILVWVMIMMMVDDEDGGEWGGAMTTTITQAQYINKSPAPRFPQGYQLQHQDSFAPSASHQRPSPSQSAPAELRAGSRGAGRDEGPRG